MSFNFGAALAVFLAASATPGTNGSAPATQAVEQVAPVIAPAALKSMLAGPAKILLVDVREPDEFNAGHIKGARLMPLGSLEATYRDLPKGVKLVVYCHSGRRSAKAVSFLLAHGYGEAVSLDGGYVAWTALAN